MKTILFGLVALLSGLAGGHQLAHLPFTEDQLVSAVPAPVAGQALPNDLDFACLSNERVDMLRRTGTIDSLFELCVAPLRRDLGPEFAHLDNEALRAVMATIAAGRFAVYGPSGAVDYAAIAGAQALNCGNMVPLAGYLFGKDSPRLRPIGFDGGAVGNHAQIYYDSPEGRLVGRSDMLLDPTTGLVALVEFDNLLQGRPVEPGKTRFFKVKDRTEDIANFRIRVAQAVLLGQYKPSDFMYLHETVVEMATEGSVSDYFTPGGILARQTLAKQRQ